MDTPQQILVVEGDPQTRELLQEYLERHHFKVLVAEDGLQGMEYIQSRPLDLLILNIDVEYINGVGLIQLSRQHHAALPTICMTGCGVSFERVAGQENPDIVLSQPLNPDELLQSVQSLLSRP